MNNLLNLDYKVFIWLNSFAGHSKSFDWLMLFLGHYFPYLIAVGLVAAWFFVNQNNRKALGISFLAFVLSRGILVEVVRKIVPRNRPFLSYEVVQLIAKGMEKSFPSGHAAAFFAIAAGMYLYNKKVGLWLFVTATIISLARVISGVHYPSDILAGALVGIFSAWFVNRVFSNQIENLTEKISFLRNKFFL